MAKRSLTPKAKAHADAVFTGLTHAYPNAECELNWRTPFELLIATILSAQCTDKRVNLVTPSLFQHFPTAEAMAHADVGELEELIRTTGFFRSKAKNILGASRALVEHHRGHPPKSIAELIKLPGVARKTANVVLGVAYHTSDGVVVDTHVLRVGKRLGLTTHEDPKHVEQDLMTAIAQPHWIDLSHRLIAHGRAVCKALRPNCDVCSLAPICPTLRRNKRAPIKRAQPPSRKKVTSKKG